MTYASWLLERARLHMENAGPKTKQFFLEENFTEKTGDAFIGLREGFVARGSWALQNPQPLLEAMERGHPFGILVGMRPHTRLHVGHLTLMRELDWLIQQGGQPIFVYAGYEAEVPLTEQDAIEETSRFNTVYTNFTGKPLPPTVESISDQDSEELSSLEERVAKTLTIRKILQLYGWDQGTLLTKIRIPAIVASSFLLSSARTPNKAVVVLTDINQVTHAEVARIAAKQLDIPFPTFSYRYLLQSLEGPEKRMSTKNPKSVIFLNESPEELNRKLQKSFSGGCASPEEQRISGGNPLQCSFFSIAEVVQSRSDVETMYENCVTGSALCAQCKGTYRAQMVDRMVKYSTP